LSSPRFPLARRLPIVLALGVALPSLLAAADALTSIRLFSVLTGDAESLSGRENIWPLFQDAWDASPWVGWGIGAAKMLVDPDSLLAHLLGTTTAHNEYLRMGVDGGWIGIGLIVALFTVWTVAHTGRMNRPERRFLRLVLLAFAVHSFTDSTLIATTASVLFAWVAAVFARADREAEQARIKVLGGVPRTWHKAVS
jgi:O-antigen ligase